MVRFVTPRETRRFTRGRIPFDHGVPVIVLDCREEVRMRRWAVAVVATVVVVATAAGFTLQDGHQALAASSTNGYWLVATDGGVFSYGQAAFHGSTGNIVLNQPIVGMASSRSGKGYWMVATDGGIFAFGDARFLGSMGARPLNKPIVAMAATPSGNGYWLVASDGGIFAFGDAAFHGSMGSKPLNKPIVDIAATPTGRGYWLVGSDGGIFAFGDARFFGGTGDRELNKRIQAMAATPTGRGYWLLAGDGGVFAFGDARFFGSTASGSQEKRVLDMAASATGNGYWLTNSAGDVFAFGDARFYGSASKINHRITGIVPLTGNEPPVAVEDNLSLPEDSLQTINVLGNDRDPEGGPLTVAGATNPGHGSVQVVDGRAITYTPARDFSGPDAFTYTVSDDRGGVASARVNVMVSAVDDRPEAVDDSLTVEEDQLGAAAVLANDTGLGDGVKDVVVVSQPKHGKATRNGDLTITYKPGDNSNGPDTFRYKVTDSDGDSSEGNVQVTVNAVDDVPVAGDDGGISTPPGKSVGIPVQDNDSSGDGEARIELVDGSGAQVGDKVTTAEGGTAERDGDKIRYSPKKGWPGGRPDTFRYVLVDVDGDVSNPALVTVTVDGNNRPEANNLELAPVPAGQTASGQVHATDRDGHSLTYKVSGPNPDPANCGDFVFRSSGEFSCRTVREGRVEFRFVANDGFQDSAPATVTIPVSAPPPPPPPASPAMLGAGPAAALAPLAARRRRR
jgi:hypothetical protein